MLIGARTPEDLLYPTEYDTWRGADIDVRVTVDRANSGWTGRVGVVTTLFDRLAGDPAATTAFVCGPEVMMRFAALALIDRDVPPAAVRVSLERNMRCGAPDTWPSRCGYSTRAGSGGGGSPLSTMDTRWSARPRCAGPAGS